MSGNYNTSVSYEVEYGTKEVSKSDLRALRKRLERRINEREKKKQTWNVFITVRTDKCTYRVFLFEMIVF